MHARPTPAEILRNHLEIKRRTMPMFLRPQLLELIGVLDDWVLAVEQRQASLEARMRGLDKMPSAAALDLLNQPVENHA